MYVYLLHCIIKGEEKNRKAAFHATQTLICTLAFMFITFTFIASCAVTADKQLTSWWQKAPWFGLGNLADMRAAFGRCL
jgi:uncharacterized iron-regulated membrane protein